MYIGIYSGKIIKTEVPEIQKESGIIQIETDTPGGSGSLTAKDQTYTLERHHAPMVRDVKAHGMNLLAGRLVIIPEVVVLVGPFLPNISVMRYGKMISMET